MAILKITFCLSAMDFSKNRLLFLFSWERGFLTGNSDTGEPSTLHKQTISGEELITFMVNVMASNSGWLIN